MSHNFWRFASALEMGFHVPYDRDKEVVLCPECEAMIVNSEWDITDYCSTTSDGYLIYKCPICHEVLTVTEIDK